VTPPTVPTAAEILTCIEDAIAADRPRPALQLSDTIRESLRLDSLALLEILTRIEDRLGIELIDAPAVYSVTTVSDLVDLITATVAEQQAATT
jgi:acyl carrier protein